MPIQQKLPPPVLLFSDFADWDVLIDQNEKKRGINFQPLHCSKEEG